MPILFQFLNSTAFTLKPKASLFNFAKSSNIFFIVIHFAILFHRHWCCCCLPASSSLSLASLFTFYWREKVEQSSAHKKESDGDWEIRLLRFSFFFAGRFYPSDFRNEKKSPITVAFLLCDIISNLAAHKNNRSEHALCCHCFAWLGVGERLNILNIAKLISIWKTFFMVELWKMS
jgi:hypothetical protein